MNEQYIGVHSVTKKFITVADLDHMLDTDVIIVSFVSRVGQAPHTVERTVEEIKEIYAHIIERIADDTKESWDRFPEEQPGRIG